MQSPLADVVVGTQRAMSASESALFMDDRQRARLLTGLKIDRFQHDFRNVEYSEVEFDDRLGLPGLHVVKDRSSHASARRFFRRTCLANMIVSFGHCQATTRAT